MRVVTSFVPITLVLLFAQVHSLDSSQDFNSLSVKDEIVEDSLVVSLDTDAKSKGKGSNISDSESSKGKGSTSVKKRGKKSKYSRAKKSKAPKGTKVP